MSKSETLSLPRLNTPGSQRKLSIQLDGDLASELESYGAAYASVYGETVELEILAPHMLRRFIEQDRSFKRWKASQKSSAE